MSDLQLIDWLQEQGVESISQAHVLQEHRSRNRFRMLPLPPDQFLVELREGAIRTAGFPPDDPDSYRAGLEGQQWAVYRIRRIYSKAGKAHRAVEREDDRFPGEAGAWAGWRSRTVGRLTS